MGTPWDPDDPDYEVSDTDCVTCTPSLWPADETPVKVVATFSGIEICADPLCALMPPPPNGQPFICNQVLPGGCQWQYNGAVWLVNWYAAWNVGTETFIELVLKAGFITYFSDRIGSPCAISFTNADPTAWPHCGQKGTGVIT